MPSPREHKTVQASILAYGQEIGWRFVPHAEARRGFDPDGATPGEHERREIVTVLDAVTRAIPVQHTKRRLLEALFTRRCTS